MKLTRRAALAATGITATSGLAGCSLGDEDESEPPGTQTEPIDEGGTGQAKAAVDAAFVYHDVVGDFGWQSAHEAGRRRVDEEADWLETTIFDDLSANGSRARFKQIAQRGFDVVFGTSFGYMEPMYDVAPAYPDVAFENCAGYRGRDNLGYYFGRMYQARYLSGIAAGLLTEANQLGYVAAFPISEVIRGINAFALGALSVNDEATVRVRYTDTWNDAAVESEAAKRLIEVGVDVMAQHQNFPSAANTAAEAGIWATGYNLPMGEFVGENYVTSPVWNWAVFYREALRELFTATWHADFYWEGLRSGVVDLSEWGPKVPDNVVSTVAERRSELIAGDLDVWAGTPFADYDDEQLYKGVERYVENVVGDAPE
jgi:basic membrane protein A